MLSIHLAGAFGRRNVLCRSVPNSRKIVPEVEAIIQREWHDAQQRADRLLFDGPVCRLERFVHRGDQLELELSPSGYKVFWGTNLRNPQLAEQFGSEVMGNTAGLSPSLLSSDHMLLLGRRNSRVAYYPSRVHPFAGAMDQADMPDCFAGIERELSEELSITTQEIDSICLSGIAEDHQIRQKELIFAASVRLTSRQIQERLDTTEHVSLVQIPATPHDVEMALGDPFMTPVACASLILFGRMTFGEDWMKNLKFPAVR